MKTNLAIALLLVGHLTVSGKDSRRYLIVWPTHIPQEGEVVKTETRIFNKREQHVTIPGKEQHTNSVSFVHLSASGVVVSTNRDTCKADLTVSLLQTGSQSSTNLLLQNSALVKVKQLAGEWFFSGENQSLSLETQQALGKVFRPQSKNRFKGINEEIAGFNISRKIGETWKITDADFKARFLEGLRDFGATVAIKDFDCRFKFSGLTNILGVECFDVFFEGKMKSKELPWKVNERLNNLSDKSTVLSFVFDNSFSLRRIHKSKV